MWNETTEKRLKIWLEFRDKINSLPLDLALKETAHLWSYAPFVNYHLDSDDISQWPDPWQLLHENEYCNLSIALGMFYTVCLSNHQIDSCKLQVISDSKGDYFNIVVVNNQYVLNYNFDEIVNISAIANSKIRNEYSSTDLKIDNYK